MHWACTKNKLLKLFLTFDLLVPVVYSHELMWSASVRDHAVPVNRRSLLWCPSLVTLGSVLVAVASLPGETGECVGGCGVPPW